MAKGRKPASSSRAKSGIAPAISPEARENQLIALAYDQAEQQLRDGTAPPSVIAHFLKMGSTKERLERSIMEDQGKLVKAKTDAIESSKRSEELYDKAIKAMQRYSGHGDDDEPED